MKKESEIVLNNLDFTGGSNSWFDMWHTHMDWHGVGNKNWSRRKQYIQDLLEFYSELRNRLSNFHTKYQVWVFVHENDSANDAVYVHSPNPNAENFPFSINNIGGMEAKNQRLKAFLEGLGLDIIMYKHNGEISYYLFDKNIGLALYSE